MFKDRLKTLRVENNYTQQELAEKLSCSRTAISGYEVGRNEPSYSDLNKIADLFNVSIDFLTGKTDLRNDYRLGELKFQFTKFQGGKMIELKEDDFNGSIDFSELYINLGKSNKDEIVEIDNKELEKIIAFINKLFKENKITQKDTMVDNNDNK